MKPESAQSHLDIWVLMKLGTNGTKPSYGTPWTVMLDGEVYTSLHLAQQAQTFEALKSGIKYEIFHLEFPI